MDQQMFHHLTTVPKADITAEVFRTTYPDVSLQPVRKSTSNETAKTSTVQNYQVAGLSEAAGEEEEEVDEEDEDDGIGENIQYVQSQQVTTVPVIYQTHSQTTMVQKAVHIGLPLQTTQQIRLQQNGVIIQPQQLVYTRYTTNNGQVVNTPTPALQEVVVSNAVGESPTPVKQFVGQVEEGEVDGEQTINCSIQCVNTKAKIPQGNVQQWTQQTQQQPLSREKAKSTNITTISASSAAAVDAAVNAKAKRSPQKKPPNEPKRKVRNVKEKPTNVVLPMYSTTKGQITTIPKFQLPQTTVSPVNTNASQNVVQVQTLQPSLPPTPPIPPPPPPPTIPLHNEEPNVEQVLGSQILIIMPDKSKRTFILDQQNKDYRIHDLMSELGVCPDEITINFQVRSQNHSDEDLNEENQREEEEMALNEAEEEVIHQEAQEDHDEELSEEMSVSGEGDEHSKEHIKEKPLYRSGYLAICNFCGYSSCDFNKCQRCHRKFPPNVRAVSASSVMKTAGHSSQKGGRKTKCDSSLDSESPRKKAKGGRKKRLEEPVCLTISDDEEGGGNVSQDSSQLTQRAEPQYVTDPVANLSASQKEPVITEETGNEEGTSTEAADENFPEEEVENECTRLHCRTVRIGSYKVVPQDKVLLSPLGVKIHVPALDSTPVTVTILFHEIIRVLISFHKSLPVLFFYTNSTAATRIREVLKMTDQDNLYYNPASKVDAHKRITLLPEVLDEDNRLFLKQLFGNSQKKHKKQLLYELNSKEANDILVRASPKDVQETLGKRNPALGTPQLPPATFDGGIHTIMVYPPPPTKGGIPINTEDYACLGEDQFLNDVIIDFYLKYLVLTDLSQVDQARTHVFSSFFYKRLTTRPPKATRRCYHPIEDDPNISPAVKRHSRVKSWTKAVDLFSKDFIIIPINENCHWYLAIICFPGLKGPVRISDNQPIKLPDKKKTDGKLDSGVTDVTAKVLTAKKAITIGSTTITAVVNTTTTNQTVTLDAGGEEEDRDEADGDDEDMESNHSSDNESDESVKSKTTAVEEEKEVPPPEQEEKKAKKVKGEREPIKQPCILIFDSLAGGSRARVVATLRDYLRIEYKMKHKGEERDFSKDVMKGASPKVPQQTNFTDCGLYLLQYVEAFFQMPIKDYHIPIKELQNWFTADLVSQKRYQIQQLLHFLMEEQKIDIESLNLPNLRLKDGSQKGQLVDYSCSEEEEDEEMEEEEEDEHMDGELGEQGELLDEEIMEDELCEEELEEQMCEEDGLCVDGMGEMCEEEEEYLGEEEEELCEEEEELDDGEVNPDNIPEPARGFNLKSVRIHKVFPTPKDSLSPRKKHRADDK